MKMSPSQSNAMVYSKHLGNPNRQIHYEKRGVLIQRATHGIQLGALATPERILQPQNVRSKQIIVLRDEVRPQTA